jgi:hypothetical protein
MHGGNELDSMEIWDPSTGTFTETGSLRDTNFPAERHGMSVFPLVDGRVAIVSAGCICNPRPVAPAEVWDPTTGSTGTYDNLKVRAFGISATQLSDGRILIAGGSASLNNTDPTTSAEVWDPIADAVAPTGSMAYRRNGAASVLLPDGRVLMVGGSYALGAGDPELRPRPAEIWDPTTDAFTTLPSISLAIAADPYDPARALVLLDGSVLFFDNLGAWVWDPEQETLSAAGRFPERRSQFTATVLLDGRVLVAGGSTPAKGDPSYVNLATTLLWDPATASFTPGPSLLESRSGHTATLLQDGRVLIVGGVELGGLELVTRTSAEVFEPGTP